MELKKLYRDAVVLCKRELSLNDFLLWCDIAARTFLSRYPKKLILPNGEYSTPKNLGDSLMIADAFYGAVLYFVAGAICENDSYRKLSDSAASEAYLAIWKDSARGKRMKGDTW